MKSALFFLMALIAAVPLPALAEKEIDSQPVEVAPPVPGLPAEARMGDALLVWMPRAESSVGFSGEARLLAPGGAVIQRSAAFHISGKNSAGWDVCALGVPSDAAEGVYTVDLRGVWGGQPYFSSHAMTIRTREFLSEDIPLAAGLTALRTEQTLRKETEARLYNAILGRVDPDGIWLDGPFIRPVSSERRTSFFGDRRRYLYATGGSAASVHAGIDFAAPTGTPIKAAGRGRVVLAANRVVTGNTVILEHLPGVYTIYMHMDSLAVEKGAIVERGAPLGTAGATGLATGPHLHWELRVCGEACDPESPAFAGLYAAGLNGSAEDSPPAAGPVSTP